MSDSGFFTSDALPERSAIGYIRNDDGTYRSNVFAIPVIGGPDGETTHVAQQVATKAHLPLISPVSSDPSLTHTRVPWIFRLPPDDSVQAEELMAKGLGPRNLKRHLNPCLKE